MTTDPSMAQPPSKEARFVLGIIARCQQDTGLAARLRRADNPATEYQSWEFMAQYGVDLERDHERLRCALVAASIAKTKPVANGAMPLGRAIAACYADQSSDDQATARLRRLLACADLPELCLILRSILTLIASRVTAPLDYVRLLEQLRRFDPGADRVKAQWAQEFFRSKTEVGEPS